MSHTLSLEYPENLPDALHMSRAEFEQEARLAMAAKLFETGKLSSGQAARLVGMARVAFLSELGRLGVSAIQIEPDELAQDLAAAEAAAGDHPQQ
jgi:predicted HTH domain antitoxin